LPSNSRPYVFGQFTTEKERRHIGNQFFRVFYTFEGIGLPRLQYDDFIGSLSRIQARRKVCVYFSRFG
ncbi:MAG: hypothetical protein ACI4SW_00350, partial [Thermoguttaceae bacterium]